MQPLLLLLLLALSPVSSFPGSCIKRSGIRKDVPNSFNILKSEGRLRAANGEGDAVSKEWDEYFRTSASKERYQIVAAPEMESLAQQIVEAYPSRFRLWPTQWKKFPDGTDNIEIGGFSPTKSPRRIGASFWFLCHYGGPSPAHITASVLCRRRWRDQPLRLHRLTQSLKTVQI